MRPDDRVRLRHIADALRHAIRFAEGRGRDDLESDAPDRRRGGKQDKPRNARGAPIGMRNRLVHAYADIDPDVVWRTVTEFAPDLLAEVDAILGAG